jgi:hypothetical protein
MISINDNKRQFFGRIQDEGIEVLADDKEKDIKLTELHGVTLLFYI